MVKVQPIKKGIDGGVDLHESMLSLRTRGKTGPSSGLGFLRLGSGRYGATNRTGGIYQKRVTGYNQYGRNPARRRRAYYVKMRTYRPTNPRTELQQANRNKLGTASSLWNTLDPVEKSRYNDLGKRSNKSGRNLFISWYMKNN